MYGRCMGQVLKRNGSVAVYDVDGKSITRGAVGKRDRSSQWVASCKLALLNYVSEGGSITGFLQERGVPYNTFSQWKAHDVQFRTSVELARSERASYNHETFYEKNLKRMASEDIVGMEGAELDEYRDKISTVGKVQKLLDNQKAQDAPKRFGTKVEDAGFTGNVEVKSVFTEEQFDKLLKVYTPRVNNEGVVEVPQKDTVLTSYKDIPHNSKHERKRERLSDDESPSAEGGATRPPRARVLRRKSKAD